MKEEIIVNGKPVDICGVIYTDIQHHQSIDRKLIKIGYVKEKMPDSLIGIVEKLLDDYIDDSKEFVS